MAKELIKRSEAEVKYTWALEDLYPNEEAWEKQLSEARKYPEMLAKYQGRLGVSAAELLEYLKLIDASSLVFEHLEMYAGRKRDQDTQVAKYQGNYGAVMSLYADIMSAMAFDTPELLKISDDKIEQFYKEEKGLLLYKNHLDERLRKREHTLSEQEEVILAAAGDVSRSISSIYEVFNDADLRFPEIVDAEGNSVRLTHGNYISFMEGSDRRVRKDAFTAIYSVFGQFKNTVASLLDAQMKQQLFYAKAKKYPSNLHLALDTTNVPVSVYHSLIDAVHDNCHIMHRYMALRKKLLALPELHMYDLYTPVISDADRKIPFEEAKQIVLESLAPLGEEYVSIVREGFENRWIDVYENEGKRSGAYSAGSKVHPYVLLNHSDTLESMFTLAHEMGHALHSYLSNKNQPAVYSQYTIFVAEVASTCNEALLVQHLLKDTTDKKQRAYLINHFLEAFRLTFFRQTMFAEFELEMNRIVESGESLTSERLCSIYHELNVRYYGDDIIVDPEIDLEWARIPHFFFEYYVYQYATGFSAAIALSRKILNDGEQAVQNYLKFLGGGCSADPISLLKIAGVDMSSPKPVNEAILMFSELLDQMEALL